MYCDKVTDKRSNKIIYYENLYYTIPKERVEFVKNEI